MTSIEFNVALEIMKLKKMRSTAREKILSSNPELKKAWDEAQISKEKKTESVPDNFADASGMFTFQCDECGNIFKTSGVYAKCPCCGEDTHSMVHIIRRF